MKSRRIIYINGRFLTQSITGVQRYAREMTLALDQIFQKIGFEIPVVLIAPSHTASDLKLKYISLTTCGYLKGHLWEQIELPFYTKDGILVNFCNCAPLLKREQIVAIHDASVAAFPQSFSFFFRTWYGFMYSVLGKKLNRIMTVSNFSADEISRYYNIPKKNFVVAYNGADHLKRIVADDAVLNKIDAMREGYVLAVGSRNPSKNLSLILAAAEKVPNVRFVIAGGGSRRIFQEVEKKELPNIRYLGYVTDGELVALYRNAKIFVYPSLYEGFGIPPLEAMAHGCPVIVSNKASLPEVCGDAVLYCSTSDSDLLVRQIGELWNNESKRDSLRAKGIERASLFTWRTEAQKIVLLLRNMMT
ncbi:glycosyltransferase family 1 protein [uncultured Selenomonas sp.]|uniref:glycosyltransferase family 4 protein n=1 Tax=uncultured Selenomonas sp. TaxID=159275 RepID=UPI0028EBCC6C|nr:glycosyltransferase family 1 protein [uncultured Selenomonas sp.]